MNCALARQALSARLDDEDPGVPDCLLAEHLDACVLCRRWQEAAHEVTRTARLAPARTVTLGPDELVAAVLARSRPPRRPTALTAARIGLVLVGLAQALVTLPPLLYGRDHAAPEHVAHEMGAFAMALAVGFVIAAWKPDRARGMHALVGVAVLLLVVTATLDLAHGRTDFGDEAPHLLAIAGWLLLGRVAAATPAPARDPGWSLAPYARALAHRRPSVGIGVASGRSHGGPARAEAHDQSARERRAG